MIKAMLAILTTEQRRQLMYAFEEEFSQFIELADNKFIGVNITEASNLEVTEEAGVWSYGRIK